MTALGKDGRLDCSYILYRHAGGLSPTGVLVLTTAYASFDGGAGAGTPLVFKDDVAAAMTPNPVVFPETGGFLSQAMQYINDSATSIFFSFDGIRDHFELKAGENILFDWVKTRHIYLRGEAGGESFRLIVW